MSSVERLYTGERSRLSKGRVWRDNAGGTVITITSDDNYGEIVKAVTASGQSLALNRFTFGRPDSAWSYVGDSLLSDGPDAVWTCGHPRGGPQHSLLSCGICTAKRALGSMV